MRQQSPYRGYVRTYYPDPKAIRLRLRNWGHESSNPSPDVLPSEARALWNDVSDQSWELYEEHASQHDIPEKTAWRAVRMQWEKQGGVWVPRRRPASQLPFVLPSPEDVTWLGLLLDYTWITPEGELYKRSFENEDENPEDSDAPALWWSPDMKTLFSFPTTKTSGPCMPIDADMADQAAMYERFNQRDAQCQLGFEVDLARMYPRGMADSVSYRSDKWHDRNEERGLPGSKEYIHLHGDEVWIYEDDPDLSQTPNVVVIRGGRLDVEERGIIH